MAVRRYIFNTLTVVSLLLLLGLSLSFLIACDGKPIPQSSPTTKNSIPDELSTNKSGLISFHESCKPLVSFKLPEGHSWKPGFQNCGGWVNEPNVDDSVVVGFFALEHEEVIEAQMTNGPYRDLTVDNRTWRFIRKKDSEFQVFLILPSNDVAVGVYGELSWSDKDIEQFLGSFEFQR